LEAKTMNLSEKITPEPKVQPQNRKALYTSLGQGIRLVSIAFLYRQMVSFGLSYDETFDFVKAHGITPQRVGVHDVVDLLHLQIAIRIGQRPGRPHPVSLEHPITPEEYSQWRDWALEELLVANSLLHIRQYLPPTLLRRVVRPKSKSSRKQKGHP